MFKEIFRFELSSTLKKPMVYIFTLINFLFVFVASTNDRIIIGGSNDAVNINAPHVIMTTTLMFTLIGIFMTTAFMNSSMLKDYQHKFDGLLFSSSITKIGYLSGRFLATYIASLIPFIGVLLGIGIAGASGLVDADSVGAFDISHYLTVFFTGVMPNVLIMAAVIFLLTTIFRSSMYSFIGALAILVLYVLMGSLTSDLSNEMIAIISDPLGISSYNILTKYWTIDEKNTQMIAVSGLWVINRLIWIGVALGLIVLAYFKFSFALKSSKKNKTDNLNTATASSNRFPIFQKQVSLPQVSISDSTKNQWAQYRHQAWMETKGILKSTPFIVIMLFGIFNMLGAMAGIDQRYGTGNHPVTFLMVEAVRNSLYTFLVALLMYFAGALIWKDRDAKMNELIDTTSFPAWIPYMSKMTALLSIVAFTLSLGIVCGVLQQTMKGYANYELGIYFRELLGYDFLQFAGLVALAMFIQTLVNKKYIGYFVFLIVIVALKFGPSALDISSNLVAYGSLPSYIYSDMNGWNLYSEGLAWFSTYWSLFACLLTVLGILFWVRGLEHNWAIRYQAAKTRFTGKLSILTIALAILWLGTSSFLVYQTQIVNTTVSDDVDIDNRYNYEIAFKQYEHIAQPRITAVDYNIDLHPDQRSFVSVAEVTIKNKTNQAISDVHFSIQDGYDMAITIPESSVKLSDDILNYQIYNLNQSMQPGEERNLTIQSSYAAEGIENEISNTEVVNNGTFLNNSRFMPAIGYAASVELNNEDDRAKYNLLPKLTQDILHNGCSAACNNHYISQDADWVNLTTTISTTADQVAIAPGSLVKSWEIDGRSFYQYELEEKAINFFSFISGRFEVARDVWTSTTGEQVDVEVYHHKGHEYNVDKMTAALKHSLTYYSDNFTPYPHQQARIIEFPRYNSFAQAFPGTMPYSESIGFLANLNEEHAIDMVTYVVAHEMAHQWWGHQVIGGDVQGATVLSETFAQYSALMVMKEIYGDDKMKQFMQHEMDQYLQGRSQETKEELALLTTENQFYIHYGKGSVVMYALQDYIGEDKINNALRLFAEAKAYQEAPYTNTIEFMDYLRAETPDSLSYLLDDMIESITLYSNKTVNGQYQKLDNGQYEVTIDVEVAKYKADGQGKETLVAHDDYIDIGVFSKEIPEGEKYGRPISIKRVKINHAAQTFTLIVDEEPHTAGIDPNYLLVDRMPGDNVKVLDFVE